MEKTKKRLALLLSLLLLVSGTACSKGGAASSTAASSAAQSSAAASQSSSQTSSQSTVNLKPQLPLTSTPVTMTMVLVTRPGGVKPEKVEAWQKLETMTGVKWDLTVIDGASATEQLNLIFAGGKLPDVFYDSVTKDMVMRYNSNGYFIDMKDLIKKNAPNLQKLLDGSQAVRDAMVLPNGQISSLVWTNMQSEKGSSECPLILPYINSAWLKKLNLKVPQTYDEFYSTMIAFRDGDPNGNGKADEIPFAAAGYKDLISIVAAWHGLLIDGTTKAFLKGNTMVFAPATDEFKQTLTQLAKMYRDKLIDQDIITLSTNQIIAKGQSADKPYGSQFTSGPAYWGPTGYEDMVPVYQINKNNPVVWTGRQYANTGVFCITKECKNPGLALRWADIFYSDEYANLYWMGEAGSTYKFNSDGSWNWITAEGQTTSDLRNNKLLWSLGLGPSMCPVDWFKLNDPKETPGNVSRSKMVKDYPGACRLAIPVMYYDDADSKEISTISTDLDSYYTQMVSKFIIGEANIDSEWSTFVSKMDQMGSARLIKLLQKTYDNKG